MLASNDRPTGSNCKFSCWLWEKIENVSLSCKQRWRTNWRQVWKDYGFSRKDEILWFSFVFYFSERFSLRWIFITINWCLSLDLLLILMHIYTKLTTKEKQSSPQHSNSPTTYYAPWKSLYWQDLQRIQRSPKRQLRN